MTGGEDKAVAIQPAGVFGVVGERIAKKDGADVRAAERQTEVSRGACMNGVDGEPARLVGGFGKEGCIKGHEKKFFEAENT
jgi:hypothetical protein